MLVNCAGGVCLTVLASRSRRVQVQSRQRLLSLVLSSSFFFVYYFAQK